MKRSLYLSALLLIVTLTVAVRAQTLYTGVAGGPNIADLDINFVDKTINDYEVLSRTLFGVGGFFGVYLNEYLSIQLNPTFIEKGGVFRVNSGQELKLKSSQIDLPLTVKIEFGDMIRPYIIGGGYISFVLDAKVNTEMAGILWEGDFTNVLNDTEYGAIFGLGITVPVWYGSLFLESRYVFGLTNLNKGGYMNFTNGNLVATGIETDPNDEINTISILILLGYQLPIGW